MNETKQNETKQLFEWITREVAKLFFELGIIGMMLIGALTMSFILFQVIDIWYQYPDAIVLRVLALLMPAALFTFFGVGKGIHEKIASHVMGNSVLEKEEKWNIAVIALVAAICGGIIEFVFNKDTILMSAIVAAFVFFVFFFVFYGAVYSAKRREAETWE